MHQESNKLERLLDALTEDIFNDIECAKKVINEAGFDSTISSTEGVRKVAQLQEDIVRQSNTIYVCDVRGYDMPAFSFKDSVFRFDEVISNTTDNAVINQICFTGKRLEGKILRQSKKLSSSKHLDEGKLQLN